MSLSPSERLEKSSTIPGCKKISSGLKGSLSRYMSRETEGGRSGPGSASEMRSNGPQSDRLSFSEPPGDPSFAQPKTTSSIRGDDSIQTGGSRVIPGSRVHVDRASGIRYGLKETDTLGTLMVSSPFSASRVFI